MAQVRVRARVWVRVRVRVWVRVRVRVGSEGWRPGRISVEPFSGPTSSSGTKQLTRPRACRVRVLGLGLGFGFGLGLGFGHEAVDQAARLYVGRR